MLEIPAPGRGFDPTAIFEKIERAKIELTNIGPGSAQSCSDLIFARRIAQTAPNGISLLKERQGYMASQKSRDAGYENAILRRHIATNICTGKIGGMERDLPSVKIRQLYHHGDLRQALIDSALVVLSENGVDAFSLRETARRAGVSSAAYKHHFADTRRLMTAVATIAFTRLADALERADAAAGRTRRDRLMAQGAAYVGFALAERALFDLMWRTSLLDLSDPTLLEQKARAFHCLDRLIRGSDAQIVQHNDPTMAPTLACWSLVHGFARLMLDGAVGEETGAQKRAADVLLGPMLQLLQISD